MFPEEDEDYFDMGSMDQVIEDMATHAEDYGIGESHLFDAGDDGKNPILNEQLILT